MRSEQDIRRVMRSGIEHDSGPRRAMVAIGPEILTLRFVADLSLHEIADTPDLSLSDTKMCLYGAIERLQKLVKEAYEAELV